MTELKAERVWHKVLELDELAEGRTTSVTCAYKTLCLTHYQGRYGALDNHCSHQGGPLGEGSIENGLLRCPWHGWDFDPVTGLSPGYDDENGVESFPVEQREDGVYVALSDVKDESRTIGDLMTQTMVNWGVRQVFGMVGHSNLGIADALRTQESNHQLNYYGIRHEGAAAFACSAYGKLTGRLAACLAIAGPGATNLLTGLWDANVDRSPVLALTGQVDTQVLGTGAFQEVDQAGAFGKVAQWTQTVLADSQHAELMNLACKSALLNRGVSHLIFPDEVPKQACQVAEKAGTPNGRLPSQNIAPAEDALQAAVELLRASERPVIVVGNGAHNRMDDVIMLAEQLRAPIITTFKGKGLIADSHPLAGGVLGRSGTPVASWLMNESDALLVFGASFSNHTGITAKRPTIQVDYDLMTLAKFHAIDVPVWGEIGVTARALSDEFLGDMWTLDQTADVAARKAIWRSEKQRRLADDRGQGINSASVFAALSEAIDEDAIISVDVGNNTYSFGRYFECQHQAVLMSGYLGSIGFAFPAAMGAWAATQESDPKYAGRQVVSISGDGGFGQYLAELNTAVKYEMNITHILLNNGELGKISKEQQASDMEVWQTHLHNPNFAEYAQLCGALGVRVTDKDSLIPAMHQVLNHSGPALLEIMTDSVLI